MVLATVFRQSAAKRIPLIKFRRQREEEAVARSGPSSGSGVAQGNSSSPAAVCSGPSFKMQTILVRIDFARKEYIPKRLKWFYHLLSFAGY